MSGFGRPWSESDLAILRKNYPKFGSRGCQKLLESKRTEKAIEEKSYRIGLCLLDEDGNPRRRGVNLKHAERKPKKRKPVEEALGYGWIPGGRVSSIWELAQGMT